jgi:hypothetical protein
VIFTVAVVPSGVVNWIDPLPIAAIFPNNAGVRPSMGPAFKLDVGAPAGSWLGAVGAGVCAWPPIATNRSNELAPKNFFVYILMMTVPFPCLFSSNRRVSHAKSIATPKIQQFTLFL